MSESSSDKTKRKFTALLTTYYWSHQVTVFYSNYLDRNSAPIHKEKITRALRQLYPQSPFLYRLCLSKPIDAEILNDSVGASESVVMPYHTFFTTIPINKKELKASLQKRLGCEVTVRMRYVASWKVSNYIKAVKRDDPHDLEGYFPELKYQRRTAFIGKQHAIPRDKYSMTDDLKLKKESDFNQMSGAN